MTAAAAATLTSDFFAQMAGRQMIERATRAPMEELTPRLAEAYERGLIVRGAVLEMATIIVHMAFRIERQFASLAASLFLTAVVAIGFPTQSRFEAWLARIPRDRT